MISDRLQQGVRVTALGMVTNVFLAGVKLVAGIFGSSHAIVADAVESLADIFSSAIVWRSLVVSSTPADEDHPYGHGKAEPLAAAVVSTMLLLAATWIAVEAVREIVSPHQGPAAFTLVVLVLVIVVKEALFRYRTASGCFDGKQRGSHRRLASSKRCDYFDGRGHRHPSCPDWRTTVRVGGRHGGVGGLRDHRLERLAFTASVLGWAYGRQAKSRGESKNLQPGQCGGWSRPRGEMYLAQDGLPLLWGFACGGKP